MKLLTINRWLRFVGLVLVVQYDANEPLPDGTGATRFWLEWVWSRPRRWTGS